MSPTHVELKVEVVALDWKGNPIVVLREKDGHRAVFIWVGISEATAISMEMEGQTAPRPMTHDLLVSVLREVDVTVERVLITDVRTNTYYAELVLSDGEDTRTLDCRPSDAIAIALRTRSPILIPEELLDRLDEQRKDSGVELSPGAGATFADQGDSTIH